MSVGTLSSSCAQVYRALLESGADPIRATILTAISMAESGCDPTKVRRCPPDCVPGQLPEVSVGAFQINLLAHPQISEECARDPVCAARYALKLPLTSWTTFLSGEYLKYLPEGLRPVRVQVPNFELSKALVTVSVITLVVIGIAGIARRRRR